MKHSLSILLLLTLWSCTEPQTLTLSTLEFKESGNILLEPFNESSQFRFADEPLVTDSFLLIRNLDDTNILFVFNRFSGDLIQSFGVVGNGPNEFISPNALSYNKNRNTLFINDYNTQKVVALNLDNINSTNRDYEYQFYPIGKHLTETEKIYYLGNDSLFIGKGFNNRLYLCTTSGIKYINNEYCTHQEIKTPKDWSNFMNPFPYPAIRPDGKKIADASLFGCVLEIYDTESDKITLTKRLCFAEPIFDKKNHLYTPTPQTIYGFTYLFGTNRYIYATAFAKENPTERPSVIWKFDWEGNPITSYSTNYPLINFCVDETDTHIYATVSNDNGEQIIVKGKI